MSDIQLERQPGLRIDMTRGVPSPEQLDLSSEMSGIGGTSIDGIDCRNYGHLEGLPRARALMASLLSMKPDETIVGGNSSLQLMHDVVAHARLCGVSGDDRRAWQESPVMICPTPGYDRHHNVCVALGIRMLAVPMTSAGPDMELVRRCVRNPEVVGIWCTPVYQNPTGITYSDDVVRELAEMQPANAGFRIIWDKAYAVHDLTETPATILDVHEACKNAGNPNRTIQFASTSKITWAGAGISAVGMSTDNVDWFKPWLFAQTIGHDKLNQLRHVLFLKDMEGVRAHMARHRTILKPKFDAVLEIFERKLARQPAVFWSNPLGGYFIMLSVPGCASRIVELAAQAGVKLTPAGATHPYGADHDDAVVRIAPTCLSVDNVTAAAEVVALCVLMAVREKNARD